MLNFNGMRAAYRKVQNGLARVFVIRLAGFHFKGRGSPGDVLTGNGRPFQQKPPE